MSLFKETKIGAFLPGDGKAAVVTQTIIFRIYITAPHTRTFEFSLLAHLLEMLLGSMINSHISLNFCQVHLVLNGIEHGKKSSCGGLFKHCPMGAPRIMTMF